MPQVLFAFNQLTCKFGNVNFAEATNYLFSLGHETLAMKLGLRNTELLLESLGNPHKSFESVQIAGTNGKGSTAVILDSICQTAGVSTGLYTSPHLISVCERISINGRQITEAQFAALATTVRSAAEKLRDENIIEALPTFFEHVTAIALLAFREARVSLAILETGLGGRLDATTVAGAQTVAITPISFDHQEYLGETLPEIAAEKAAIIRPGVIAIVAPQPVEALDTILKRCAEVNVEPVVHGCAISEITPTAEGLLTATFQTGVDTYERVTLGLRGRHQTTNAAVAIQLAEALRSRGFAISHEAIVTGLQNATHEGRLSNLFDSNLLLDGAHNPSAARCLRSYLDEFVDQPITLVFGAMKDKALREMAEILFPRATNLVLTKPDNPRAASADSLLELARDLGVTTNIYVVPNVSEALVKARAVAGTGGVVCVTGSLYLVGEATAAAGLTKQAVT